MSIFRTAECVSRGHPDKAADQISDAVVDALCTLALRHGHPPQSTRSAVETLIKDRLVIVSGEIAAPRAVLADLDIEAIVQSVWDDVGYAHEGRPTVINYIKPQSAEIAALVDGQEHGAGAGDQGIMWGHAFRDTLNFMPREYELARGLIAALADARRGALSFLRSDAKSQVSLDAQGRVVSVIVSTQHEPDIALPVLRAAVMDHCIRPVLGDVAEHLCKINHKGSFVLGGAAADAGVTGRKIVVDAYGPRVPVGGGAFSGKDPSKVDRSAAYMARYIARRALIAHEDAQSAHISLAFGIGQVQPCAVSAVLDDGRTIGAWMADCFPDLSPRTIQSRLGLWERRGWTFSDTAHGGHFGRACFPWEQ